MARSIILGIIMVLAYNNYDCDTTNVLNRGEATYVMGAGGSMSNNGAPNPGLGAMYISDLWASAYPWLAGACLQIMIVTVYSALISELLYQLLCVVVSVTIQTTRAGL